MQMTHSFKTFTTLLMILSQPRPEVLLRLAPLALAALLLAAHFLRSGRFFLVALSLGTMALFFLRYRWSARAIQAALALGVLEWLRTLVLLVATRRAMGQPFLRLTLILGGVALLTMLAGLVFRSPVVREHFRFSPETSEGN